MQNKILKATPAFHGGSRRI